MKKITFILLALVSGSAFAQISAEGTADVFAEIVSPISIQAANPMMFGKIPSTEAGGNVTINENGLAYFGEGLEIPSNTGQMASFDVTAESVYSITLPGEVELKNSDEITMKLNNFKTNLASDVGVMADVFSVGATLRVGPNQASGEYKGEVTVTVAYD